LFVLVMSPRAAMARRVSTLTPSSLAQAFAEITL